MKLSSFFILITLSLISCIGDQSRLKINMKKNANANNYGGVSKASVSTVQIINNQLVITGTGLNAVLNVRVDGTAFSENFSIESKSATQIMANSLRAFSFDVSKVFNVILSDANASATFPIDFSLCNATLNGRGFDCAAPISDKDVLSYDAVSGTWKPRAVSGLNYLGAFNASANPATGPAIQPAGAYYIISASGAIATIPFTTGDWLVSNGSSWQKIDNSTAVLSVFGRNGAVTAQSGDYNLDMLGDISFPTAPVAGKVLKFDGTHWVAGDDLSGGGAGSVTTTEILDGAVTDAKITTLATSKLTGTISSAQIADATIMNADINAAAAIDYSKLNVPDGAIPAVKINGLPVLSSILAASITDGDTTHAPTGEAVYEALLTKIGTGGGTLSVGTISGIPTPVNPSDVANKAYVNSEDALRLLKAGDTMTGVLTLNSDLKVKGGANYVTIKGSAASTAYDLILPVNGGNANQVLKTDGAGVLSWVDDNTGPAAFSGTADRAVITTAGGVLGVSATTSTELSYVNGVTSSIQTQINSKQNALGFTPIDKAGDSITSGNFIFSGTSVLRANNPSSATDVVNKQYLESFGQWSLNGSDIYRLGGNVGIGTSAPFGALHINNNNSTDTADDFWMTTYSNTATPGFFTVRARGDQTTPTSILNNDTLFTLSVNGYNGTVNRNAATIKVVATNNFSTSPTADLTLATNGGAASATERMRITSVGNVGIGTISPQSKLDVNGSVRLGADATACTAANAGAMKFNTPNVEFCNGSAWTVFGVSNATVASAQITDGTITDADINASANITATKLGTGAVDNTEFNFLDGVTSSIQTQLNGKQATDATLTSLAAYNSAGILVQTAADTFTGRSIAGTANRVTVANGNGVSGDPTLNISTTLLPSPTGVDTGKFLKATAADTSAWTALASSDVTTALGFTPINKAGDTLTAGTFTLSGGAILRTLDPVAGTDVANKQYVDSYGQWIKSGSDISYSLGNVGIGTNAPGANLQINQSNGATTKAIIATRFGSSHGAGGGAFNSYFTGGSEATPAAPSTGDTINSLNFFTAGTTGAIFSNPSFSIRHTLTNQSASLSNVDTSFMVNTTTTGVPFSAMTLQGITGNVGIGTTTPGSALEVNAPVSAAFNTQFKVTDGTTGGYWSISDGASGAAVYLPTFDFSSAGIGGFGGVITGQIPDVNDTYVANYAAIALDGRKKTGGALVNSNILSIRNNGAPVVTVKANGNLGVGTTSPAYLLSIYRSAASVTSNIESGGNGNTAMNRFAGLTNGGVARVWGAGLNQSLGNGEYEVYDYTAGESRLLINTSGYVGIGTTAPSEKLEVNGNVKATSYLYTSDRRLKSNIVTIEDSLAKILSLRGVEFDWNKTGEHEIGLIAQEVEAVEPNLVMTSSVDGMKAVKYGNIVALLIEAMKAEHKIVQENQKAFAFMQSGFKKLDQRTSKLEREVASLKEENAELKNELEKIKKHLKIK